MASDRNVKLRGTFTVVHADGARGNQTSFYLATASRHVRLKFRRTPSIRPQSRIEVRGVRVAGAVRVATATVSASAASIDTTRTRRLLAILVRWNGASLRATQSGTTSFLFGSDERSTDSWYRQASYGQLGWTGDVTPVLTIADPGSCNLWRIADDARAAAIAAGYDVDAYDNVMVDFPTGVCGADGYGQVGGRISWIVDHLATLDNGADRYVVSHELGHNLGRFHSHGLECGTVTVDAACLSTSSSNNEYGNLFDVMGNNRPGWHNGAVGTFSAKPLIELGWLAGRWLQVTESGSYDVAPLELAEAPLPQALVIDTPAHTYFVELRQPLGVDSYLAAFGEATDGVQVSMRDELPGADNGPLLLDMAPESTFDDFLDATLNQGQSFIDVGGVVRLTVESVTPDAARITVEFAPEITAGPSGATASPSATFEFTSKGENDAFQCRLDAGEWADCVSPVTYTGLAEGEHLFAVRVRDAAGNVGATEARRTFLVDYTPPAVVLTGPAAGAFVSGAVTLTADAVDRLSGVTRVKWFLDGVEIATDGNGEPWEAIWNSAGVPDGSHKLFAKARDAAGNWATSRSALITVDHTPPTVVLTGPAAGALVSGAVTLTADAVDRLSGVTRVKWFLDGVEIATDGQGEPWEATWNSAGVPDGSHKLFAKARDAAGNWAASRSALITVANG